MHAGGWLISHLLLLVHCAREVVLLNEQQSDKLDD